MGQFQGIIKLDVIPGDGRNWRVDCPFSYFADAGERIDIESGLVTDLASTPRFIWWLYPPFGLYTGAAIVHDKLYTDLPFGLTNVARKKCDGILLEAMKAEGVSLVDRDVIYSQVRMWGWVAWDKHVKEFLAKQAK